MQNATKYVQVGKEHNNQGTVRILEMASTNKIHGAQIIISAD